MSGKNGIGMAFYSGDRCMMLSPDGNPDNWVIIAKFDRFYAAVSLMGCGCFYVVR